MGFSGIEWIEPIKILRDEVGCYETVPHFPTSSSGKMMFLTMEIHCRLLRQTQFCLIHHQRRLGNIINPHKHNQSMNPINQTKPEHIHKSNQKKKNVSKSNQSTNQPTNQSIKPSNQTNQINQPVSPHSINPTIKQTVNLSIHPSIYLYVYIYTRISINLSITQPVNQSIDRSINQSNRSIDRSFNQPTNQPINQPIFNNHGVILGILAVCMCLKSQKAGIGLQILSTNASTGPVPLFQVSAQEILSWAEKQSGPSSPSPKKKHTHLC
jgi:anti-sigma28 factor (negative regulator of flagellin synthesis)